jgi:SOS-response transcriptional repressor LexA
MSKPEKRQAVAIRIKTLLVQRVGATRRELAEYVGVSQQAVNRWFNGEAVPTGENLMLCAEFLNTTPGFITDGIEPNPMEEFVPIIAWGRVLTWNGTPTTEERRNTIPILMAHLPKGTFALKVKDNNMLDPHTGEGIRSGEYVLLSKNVTPYNTGYVAALLSPEDEEPVLKQYASDGRNQFLISQNPMFPPVAVNDPKCILAVAVGTYKPFIRPAGV